MPCEITVETAVSHSSLVINVYYPEKLTMRDSSKTGGGKEYDS